MRLRLSELASPNALAFLSLLAGCGGQDDPGPPDTGASPGAAASGGLDAGGPKCGAGNSGAASTGGGSDGGTSAGGSGTVAATFDTVKLVIGGGGGIMTCAAAPCHGVNGAAPPDHPLELPSNDDQRLYANLLSYVSKACNNTKLVDPCNPAQSALVTILKGACGATPRMPYGCSTQAGDCIPDEYIAAVAQWIANGAARP
jgi:hypothetical protein